MKSMVPSLLGCTSEILGARVMDVSRWCSQQLTSPKGCVIVRGRPRPCHSSSLTNVHTHTDTDVQGNRHQSGGFSLVSACRHSTSCVCRSAFSSPLHLPSCLTGMGSRSIWQSVQERRLFAFEVVAEQVRPFTVLPWVTVSSFDQERVENCLQSMHLHIWTEGWTQLNTVITTLLCVPLAVETDVPLLFQPEGKLGSAEPLTFWKHENP